ncbi:flagellar hook-basal body complex protein [Pontibacillus yanchengensis]|uniref:Flagellar hook-basal body complex protein n=2 Tax=Pontibacillus yanchengensis TaxID=462910 RepID=A0ACC7VG13_9BACI|nr:flagellar hook-basal body protein [Pontibacillus yanchengensis]MYL34247.1 flagellar hook-basal body complex protein [Pontibacillus yanchengensis]MYL53718.1 flagellar hook-basal body complex protein [Pontibacillus yanchengensis]
MLRSSMQSAVTMGQLQQKLDIIGNNLSNVNTPGYKSREADFSSLLVQQMDNLDKEGENANRVTPDGIRIGSGGYLAGTEMDLSRGPISQTDRPLDVALRQDNHMFQVQMNNNGAIETHYTRDGSFSFSANEDGSVSLVTSNGNPVLGENGPIRLDGNFDSFSIQQNGSIMVARNGEVAQQEAQISVVEAVRPRLLQAEGQNRLSIPQNVDFNEAEILTNVAPENNSMQQGALEQSNVDLAKQYTDMLTTQRAYQFNSRAISTGDQMMGLINNLR